VVCLDYGAELGYDLVAIGSDQPRQVIVSTPGEAAISFAAGPFVEFTNEIRDLDGIDLTSTSAIEVPGKGSQLTAVARSHEPCKPIRGSVIDLVGGEQEGTLGCEGNPKFNRTAKARFLLRPSSFSSGGPLLHQRSRSVGVKRKPTGDPLSVANTPPSAKSRT